MNTLKLKALLPTEDDECQNLVQWAGVKRHKGFLLLDYLVMIPNRVRLSGSPKERAMIMASWKRTGFKVGASDYILAIPTPRYPGLWLEMKRTELSVTTEEQIQFQSRMIAIGYCAKICLGWEAAKFEIERYLGEA